MSKESIEFACTKDQAETIKNKAKKLGLSTAAYVRSCALNAEYNVKIGVEPEPYLIIQAFKMFEMGLINKDDFEDMHFKIKNGCGKRALEEKEVR